MKRQNLMLVLLLGLGLLFATAVGRLFFLRFETGDIYPAYSSLRADPLGVKALYESLQRLPHPRLARNYLPWRRLRPAAGQTWLVLGASVEEFSEEWPDHRQRLESLLAGQGRLVIAFHPEHRAPRKPDQAPGLPRRSRPTADGEKPPLSLEEAWGFRLGHQALPEIERVLQPVTVRRQGPAPGPETLAWHSSLVFEQPNATWRVIYTRDGQAVVMERALSGGTLVLLSDSYLFSNEALRRDRHSDLLAWLLGGNPTVIFDEAHLGVAEEPGVGALLRKYRLHGALAVFVLLAALFAWRQAASLLPPAAPAAGGFVLGRDSSAGLVNLLRRGVQPRELLAICLEEWRKNAPRGDRARQERLARMSVVVREAGRWQATSPNLVQAFRELCRIVSEKKFAPTNPKKTEL